MGIAPHRSAPRRKIWLLLASVYSLLAAVLVVLGWPGIADDPVAMAPAILLAMPVSLLLSWLPGSLWTGITVVLAGMAVNAAVLWWLALRR